jgi:hypothetical protein
LRYAAALSQSTIHEIDLDDLKGEWVSVTETITYGEAGAGEFHIAITRVSDDSLLMDYRNDALRMWKTEADFQRPKWGIYRSLLNASSLQDEEVLFADIRVTELSGTVSLKELEVPELVVFPNPASDVIHFSPKAMRFFTTMTVSSSYGKVISYSEVESIDISDFAPGVYLVTLYSEDQEKKVVRKIIKT